MSPITKALGVLLAVNTQAAVLVMAGFWANDYLEEHYPLSFAWVYIIVPVVLVSIVHMYYVSMRYLFKLDREMRGKGKS